MFIRNLDLNKNHTLKNDQLAIMYENATCLRWPYSVWCTGEASQSGAHYMEWEDHWSRSSISIINIGVFWTVWSQHVCVCLSVYFYVWSVSSLKQTCPPHHLPTPALLRSRWKLICVIESLPICFHMLPIQNDEGGGWSNIEAVMIQSQSLCFVFEQGRVCVSVDDLLEMVGFWI